MSEALRKHVNEREQFEEFKKATAKLVDSTNIMGADKYIAAQIADTLRNSEAQDRFFLLLEDAIPELLNNISLNDGRSEASVKLLKDIQNPCHVRVMPTKAVTGFSMGIASSHNTLIQSFFRALKDASGQLLDTTREADSQTGLPAYTQAKKDAEDALNMLLTLLSKIGALESSKSSVTQRLNDSKVLLPFI